MGELTNIKQAGSSKVTSFLGCLFLVLISVANSTREGWSWGVMMLTAMEPWHYIQASVSQQTTNS